MALEPDHAIRRAANALIASKRLALIACLLLASQAVAAPDTVPGAQAPADFASLTDLRTWVEANKGFGHPQSIATDLVGLQVVVVWNTPFSGRNGTYVHTYRLDATRRWHRVDTSFFERPEPMSYAYVDGNSADVVYVGPSGRTLKKLPLAAPRFK